VPQEVEFVIDGDNGEVYHGSFLAGSCADVHGIAVLVVGEFEGF
jgi:hypothetical protein